jgi:hypothetical protein
MLETVGFLERGKAVLGRLSRTPAISLVLRDVDKVGTSGAGLHGCFAPRARACSMIKGLVKQVMPELLELCDGVLTPPLFKEVSLGSHRFSDVASPSCQALAFEKCGVLTLQSFLRPSPVDMWSLLDYWRWGCQQCPELSLPERFATFSPPWLLPTLDPQLFDGCLQCCGLSFSAWCWSVVFESLLVSLCGLCECVVCVGLARLL